jgi:hypothetical protein
MNTFDTARSAANTMIAARGYATATDVARETKIDRRLVWDALLTCDTMTRRMDYARKSGAKQFVFERRAAA